MIMLYLQKIKLNNEGKGKNSCKVALYRAFLNCGVKTWNTVSKALEDSENGDIAKEVKERLIKNYICKGDELFIAIQLSINTSDHCSYLHMVFRKAYEISTFEYSLIFNLKCSNVILSYCTNLDA